MYVFPRSHDFPLTSRSDAPYDPYIPNNGRAAGSSSAGGPGPAPQGHPNPKVCFVPVTSSWMIVRGLISRSVRSRSRSTRRSTPCTRISRGSRSEESAWMRCRTRRVSCAAELTATGGCRAIRTDRIFSDMRESGGRRGWPWSSGACLGLALPSTAAEEEE